MVKAVKTKHPLGRAGVGCKEGAKIHVAQITCSLRLTYYNAQPWQIITTLQLTRQRK
jgi:hypothetical protein